MNDMYRINLDLTENDPEWELIQFFGEIPEKVAEHKGVLYKNNFYIFGGVNQSEEALNKIYIYSIDDNFWTKKDFNEKTIPPITGHSMTLVGDKLVVFGGFSKGAFTNTVYTYDILENSWRNNEQHENDNEILEEGGVNPVPDTTEAPSIPDPRINHSQVTVNTSIVIYGGVDKNGNCFNDLWMFDLITNYWKKINVNGEIPKARQGHTAMLVDDDQILFFGGKIANIFEVNELWKFDLSTNRFELIQGTLLQREGFNRQIKPRIISEETTNHNPYQTFYKLKKVYMKTEGETLLNKKEGNKEKANPYEDIIMGDNKVRNIKNSLIFKITQEDATYINNLVESNKNLKFERFKYGDVPLPRDGHSSFMYDGKMFIFGGDRNKYPFNDIFFFEYEKCKNKEEIENNNGQTKNTVESKTSRYDN
jgi:N-acetylneuraminic acid mutarotase